MASTPPDLPNRFPCWCRAVYSWGGETEKDLGFIEGDLIECLNAGDGSWWVGRLRRDRRMMGSFPSNFVMVLDESFQPASRAASPLPAASPQKSDALSPSRGSSPQPPKQKSSACRKPFQGYKKATTPGTAIPDSSSQVLPQVQDERYDLRNPPSTVLWAQGSQSRHPSRSPSPMPQPEMSSSPPPPPPPHRVAVGNQHGRTPSPIPHHARSRVPNLARTPSPDIFSMNGHTPPMVRDAMDDVMSSLDGMGMPEHGPEPQVPFNPWSPEAFHDLQRPILNRPNARPASSLGLGPGGSDLSTRHQYSDRHNSPDREGDGPPQLSNFVQRMESRLRQMQDEKLGSSTEDFQSRDGSHPPAVPAKDSPWNSRPVSSMAFQRPSLKNRKSAYELDRTYTTKSSATNSSSGVQSNATNSSTATSMTSQSVFSAGGISATSAGSLARRNKIGSLNRRPMTSAGTRSNELRPRTPLTSVSYHSSHASTARQGAQSAAGWESRSNVGDSFGGLGGLTTPKIKKPGFFKKLLDGSKTVAASARSSIAVSQAGSTSSSPQKQRFNNGVTSIAGGMAANQHGHDAAKEMGLVGGNLDWVNVRRDVNRSNTPGPMERQERADRCQMLDHPVIFPVEELYETAEGDEAANGHPVLDAFQLSNPSFTGVDKAARFITSLPPMITPASLAQGYVCRPHRSDVQRLRAIFTWASERIAWDEDFDGEIDSRRVIQTKRGCSHEVAVLVYDMCSAIGIHAEVVRGYLKTPGEDLDLDASINRPNHYWNAVIVDNEWRMLDCSIASPTNPKRALYSSVSNSIAEPFYFLTRPLEFCYTHVPSDAAHQHILPPISHDVLLSLPCALPPYFRQKCHLHHYDTSLIRLEGLELATLTVNVAPDIELVAEVETRSYLRDSDGDLYENGDAVVRKRALAQASWYCSSPAATSPATPPILSKRYTIKALLPADEGIGTLKIYAGKRGLMHSSKDIPHPLALAVPIYHTGDNPAYEFLLRHPTPHAMRQDLYVVQPQCRRLVVGETFVFSVRQHGASVVGGSTSPAIGISDSGGGWEGGSGSANAMRPVSPNPFARPASAMSMMSSSLGGSEPGSSIAASVGINTSIGLGVRVKDKPAKLAIQSPSGKILRLTRKAEPPSRPATSNAAATASAAAGAEEVQGSVWESVVKVQERGVWRGLVLADRSARWCVWGEWECV